MNVSKSAGLNLTWCPTVTNRSSSRALNLSTVLTLTLSLSAVSFFVSNTSDITRPPVQGRPSAGKAMLETTADAHHTPRAVTLGDATTMLSCSESDNQGKNSVQPVYSQAPFLGSSVVA